MAEAAAKPTLHEIAAMPYSVGLAAMREHYDPLWGMVTPEGDDPKFRWKVRVYYSVRSVESRVVEVDAATEDEACDLAEEQILDEEGSDVDISDSSATRIDAQ
jgi:hypothetical protein